MIYEALSNIRHNDVTYVAGQIVQDLIPLAKSNVYYRT